MVVSIFTWNSESDRYFQGVSEPLKIKTIFLGGKKRHPDNTLNILSQYNSMPFKSICMDILGLRVIDELVSSNINKSVHLL